MAERNTPKPETAEDLYQQLVEFAVNTEFETPGYQAVSDYVDLQNLYSALQDDQGNFLAHREDDKKRLSFESQIRRTEQKIALLEHTISQNKSRVWGYSEAYIHVDTKFQDLILAATLEAQERISDPEQQIMYIEKANTKALASVAEAINRIRNTD